MLSGFVRPEVRLEPLLELIEVVLRRLVGPAPVCAVNTSVSSLSSASGDGTRGKRWSEAYDEGTTVTTRSALQEDRQTLVADWLAIERMFE